MKLGEDPRFWGENWAAMMAAYNRSDDDMEDAKMRRLKYETRTGKPEFGSLTLRAVLIEMIQGRGTWRMKVEIDGDSDFSRNTWYADVVKFWMSSDMSIAKIWPQRLWLEDFPKVGQKSSIRAALKSGRLVASALLHNGSVGFRIPVTLSDETDTVLDAAMAAHFADQALPLGVLDSNLEDWVLNGASLQLNG